MALKAVQYRTQGTCCAIMNVVLDDKKIQDVEFLGGCNGNLKAISKLLEGKTVDYIESMLLGNECGMRGTSCADQLAKGVRKAYEETQK